MKRAVSDCHRPAPSRSLTAKKNGWKKAEQPYRETTPSLYCLQSEDFQNASHAASRLAVPCDGVTFGFRQEDRYCLFAAMAGGKESRKATGVLMDITKSDMGAIARKGMLRIALEGS